MKRLRLELSNVAAAEIRTALAWWDQNRPAAPAALRKELRRIFEILRTQPHVGVRAASKHLPGVRRLSLHPRVRYFVFYRVSADGSAVVVLRFWHMSRGTQPDIG